MIGRFKGDATWYFDNGLEFQIWAHLLWNLPISERRKKLNVDKKVTFADSRYNVQACVCVCVVILGNICYLGVGVGISCFQVILADLYYIR